jgi:hypothetical protein
MRQFALLFAAVFLFAIGTRAQDTPNFSLFSSPFEQPTSASSSTGFTTAPLTLASASWRSPSASTSVGAADSGAVADPGSPDPAQGVYGVRPHYDFEGYLGYTFVRFYEVPAITLNTNGFNFSVIYFPKDWIGADGEFVMTLGNQYPYQARFLLGLGGARVRFAPFRENIEIWGHVLVGATHFTPQTAYGGQQTFAYEIGVGTDINTHRARYAYRFSADMVGTTYFGTYQLSPKLSVGFVYKF